MIRRRKARELAMQLLYQHDLTQSGPEEILDLFWKGTRVDPETRKFTELIFVKTVENRSQIDDLIRQHARHWRLERMAVVDRNILRLAICEFFHTDTPKVVVIDEAIEIARKFSTEESTEFVNGILDAVREEIEGRMVKEGKHEG